MAGYTRFNNNFSRDFLEVLARVMKPALEETWAREESPTGQKWPPRKGDYSHPMLNRTGRMQDSFSVDVVGGKLIAKAVDYGKYHQYGTQSIDARPWMGMPFSAEEISEMIQEVLYD